MNTAPKFIRQGETVIEADYTTGDGTEQPQGNNGSAGHSSILDLLIEEDFPAQQNGSDEAKAPERGQKPTAARDSQNSSTTAPHHTAAKSDAARLVEHAKSFRFFHDQSDRAFVQLDVSGHTETWPVESTKFRNLLGKIFYQREGRIINRNSLGDAIGTLIGIASHDGPEQSVYLRVAPHGENILVDLCDDRWRVIEIRPDGWKVLDKSPVAFIRTGSMAALPEPIPSAGSIEPLWELLNVAPEQRVLIAGALLNYFNPHGPYFVTNLVGEQGAAKSSAARIMRQLVDPNANPLRSPPKEERDLLVQAYGNHVVALDNLSTLQVWLSDGLCRLATGGGHSARALYSDLEEISVCFKKPVILNGIDDVAVRPDLQERVLQIELEELSPGRRLSERELIQKFNDARPAIFTAVLDALSQALRELPNTKLNELPRMADAALWATAGETALGFERGAFMAAYQQNLDEGASAAVEASPIGGVIGELVSDHNEWGGTVAELLQVLNDRATDDQRRSYGWPKNPRSLGRYLRRIAPALRRSGMGCEFSRTNQGRTVKLSAVSAVSAVFSAPLHAELSSNLRPEATIHDRAAKDEQDEQHVEI